MKIKVKVDLKDKRRVLMTELLPYELPLWFSNDLLYAKIKKDSEFINNISKKPIKTFIPLDYNIRRTNGGARVLSIMHPCAQINFCAFYDKYHSLMIYYCSLSEKSLRYPSKTTNAFFKNEQDIEVTHRHGLESLERSYKNYISYFKYQRYTFMYKFFESYEYNKLEKRFKSLMQVDVSKCFHNIYTHSISWAIKSKYISKRDIKKGGFDQAFDEIMRNSNYAETNGILIGPEVSRIFAEIILQRIDLNIIAKLKEKGLKVRIDYDFRRYVDDYFVYFNDPHKQELILSTINAELFKFKLNLNEAKTLIRQRPFISDISIAKKAMSQFVSTLENYRFSETNDFVAINNPSKKANEFISQLKTIIKHNNIAYSSVTNYFISIFSKTIIKSINHAKDSDEFNSDNFMAWLLVDLDLLYFTHAMDPRIVSTDKLTRAVLSILSLRPSTKLSANHISIIQKKIFDSSAEAIKIFNSSSSITYPVETLNILLLLGELADDYKIPESFIQEHFNISEEIDSPTEDGFYFLWCSIMLYIKNDPNYQSTRELLNRKALKALTQNIHKFDSAEFTLLFSDLMACPYVDDSDKNALITKIFETSKPAKYRNKYFPNKKGLIIDWGEKNG